MMRVACNCNCICICSIFFPALYPGLVPIDAPPCACGDEKYGVCRGRSLGTRLETIHLDTFDHAPKVITIVDPNIYVVEVM